MFKDIIKERQINHYGENVTNIIKDRKTFEKEWNEMNREIVKIRTSFFNKLNMKWYRTYLKEKNNKGE